MHAHVGVQIFGLPCHVQRQGADASVNICVGVQRCRTERRVDHSYFDDDDDDDDAPHSNVSSCDDLGARGVRRPARSQVPRRRIVVPSAE